MPNPLRSVVLALLSLAPPAAAGTVFVDADLATGANDGSGWADALQGPLGVQAALALAGPGDEVWVAQGVYLPTDTGSRSVSFALENGVTLYGGFLGGETDPGQRPPFGSAPSVLSGDLAGDDGLSQFGDNSFHILTCVGTNATAAIDGFEVRGGAATGSGGNNDRGGGILCLGAVSPTVRNCRFVANRSTFGGAAGYVNNGGAPTFTDCSFEDGVGGSFGGAFDVASAGAVLWERCLFRGNTAARGGALEIFASTGVVVDNCVFTANTATGSGGGGGLWMGTGGNPRVRNCTIVANTSVVNNVAGLRNQGADDATVANCILWDNVGPAGAQTAANQVNAATVVTWSIVEGGFAGTGNSGSDPLLADVLNGDLSLSAGSPAIDAGSNAEVQAGVTLDFAHAPRLADVLAAADTGAGTAPIVDLGAFEHPSAWLGLGQALAGTPGAPLLVMDGPLTGLSTVDVALSGALAGSTAFLVVGFSQLDAPFKGGVMVPDVDVALPFGTGGAGEVAFAFTWPDGVPAGVSTWYQFWVQDAGGPKGFAASGGVQGTTP
jgi:hypothetical protein